MLCKQANFRYFKSIVINAIIGGFLGVLVGFLNKTGTLIIPGIRYIFAISRFDATITGAMLGILISMVISSLLSKTLPRDQAPGSDSMGNELQFPLREEELAISKNSVQTGKVTIRKEVVQEEKIITVPVTREELVIEKQVLDRATSGEVNRGLETIRIPIREERIEVIKNPIVFEDVKIYHRQFQEIERVEENLKKETAHIKTHGNATVIKNEDEKN